MDVDVGKQLKKIRKAHGLSQRQLAERSGVTNGTISVIEKNHSSPSVSSLKKVLAGIPMTLSEFFSDESSDDRKFFFKSEELQELSPESSGKIGSSGNLNHASFKQVGDAMQHSIQVLYECYPPGTDTGEDMFSHDAEEGGVIISGEIEISVDGQVQILKAGDAYLFDSRNLHRFRNIGNEDCIIVSACTPPSF